MPVSRKILLVAVLLAVPVPAAAQSMNAEEFYQRAVKLKKKGPMALMQRKEVNALIAEVKGAGNLVKARRLAAEKAGDKGAYCPPPNNPRMGTDEYLKGIGAIPQSDRKRLNMVEAVTRMLASKFPCRG